MLEKLQRLSDKSQSTFTKTLIYGMNGSGKTLLSTSFSELGPGIMIDTPLESGWLTVKNSPNADNINWIQIERFGELRALIADLRKDPSGMQWLSIDSWSTVVDMLHRELEASSGSSKEDGRQVWGKVLAEIMAFLPKLYALPMHIVGTAGEDSYKDEASKLSFRAYPAIRGQSARVLMNSADYILYTYTEGQGGKTQYKVRLRPGDSCVAKMRVWPSEAEKIPEIVPTQQGSRLTLPKYFSVIEKAREK